MLKEAFDNKRKELGEVKFSQTSLQDPHVQKILKEIAKKHKVPEQELIDGIEKKVAEFKDIADKSPILYDTIQKNAVEKEIFDLIEKYHVADTAPKFNVRVFSKLIRLIKIEHDQFFPLRNFVDSKYLYNPIIVLVPSTQKENQKFNDVDTAAATPNGEFIFCVPFMQKLIDYAHLKGVTPKGKKYVSNGGEIPDEYAYIEFLIIHEFMHFTYADFHYQKKLKASGQIINWVGDFRTNYLLVKSGFEQLPIGLFNDGINYDRQTSYKEMYEIVKAEFEKLNKDQQERVSSAMDGMSDSHEQSDEDTDDDPNKSPEDVVDELDKHGKEIEKKISGGKEVDKEPENDKKEKGANPGEGKGSGRHGNGKDGNGSTFDYSKVRPSFTWKKLLSRMVTDAESSVEETFQKPHRRNITGVHLAQQTGSAAMKPGEITNHNALKLGFVVDSSGSMTTVIEKVYANMVSLLKSKNNVKKESFYLIKFSGSHHIYRCNFSGDKYSEINSIFNKEDNKKELKSGSVKQLFAHHIGASTNFSSELASEIDAAASKKFNILIMSDSDILDGPNFNNLKNLLMKHQNVFVILDSRSTFESFVKMYKQVPKGVTYFE